MVSKHGGWSSCYADDYVVKLYSADFDQSDRQNKLFFDVGANKGYTIATWLSVWLPQLNMNPKSVFDYISKELGIKDCGACGDCQEPPLNISERRSRFPVTLTIHAFEPMNDTYEALLKVRTRFNVSNLHIHHLAISNTTGIGNIVKCPLGAESCGLVHTNPDGLIGNTVPISTMTLDHFVEQNGIKEEIDLLKIDTEGADPLVLEGAKNLFAQERVRMLIFENHNVGVWQTTSLITVLQSLESKGFICHILGKTGLVRATKCWSPLLDLKHWSNVLCVHRRQKRLRYFLNQLLI